MTRIYIIAGEVSGDFIGSELMQSLTSDERLDIEFFGVGGPKMISSGIESLFPIEKINFMGFAEILPHIFTIFNLINKTVDDIILKSPDMLITIDSPGFTFRIAKKVRRLNPAIKIVHIVAPSVWAYKPSRALKYTKIYGCLLTLLPFEPAFFQKFGLDSRFIGHPILNQKFYPKSDKLLLRKELNLPLDTKILSVTPGSRAGEINRHTPIFIDAINLIEESVPGIHVVFVLANLDHQRIIEKFLSKAKFKFHFSVDRLKIFAAADVALAKSGTNILEIAASSTPMVVTYKINFLSYLIIKILIKIPHVSLFNIMASKMIIPELLQSRCNKDEIAKEILDLLRDQDKAELQIIKCREILLDLGLYSELSPSETAATIIKSKFT